MLKDDIHSEVYFTSSSGIYYVKVEILGMYISSITVRESLKYSERGLWVQMPAFQKDGMWKKIIEFSPSSPLKELIEQSCIDAVESKLSAGEAANLDTAIEGEMSKEELKQVFDALPFN